MQKAHFEAYSSTLISMSIHFIDPQLRMAIIIFDQESKQGRLRGSHKEAWESSEGAGGKVGVICFGT